MNTNAFRKNILFAGAAMAALISGNSYAQMFTVKVDNLTNGIYFTPMLVAAHPSTTHVFQPGQAASVSLRAMAEGGDISGLTTDLMTASATITAANTSPLGPGGSVTTAMISPPAANTNLSIVGMLLPTNDGFVGMDNMEIPSAVGVYTYYLNAYDAGTEANDEKIFAGGGTPGVQGIPACPGSDCGTGGTGVAVSDTNSVVHIHRGTLGDTNSTGGASDLDSTAHRWLNPVARVTITVN